MKNSRNIAWCCISIIVFYTSSCKPERGPKEARHYGPYYFREYSNYVYFKPGTYWIYENNRTGELDTCTLVSMKRDTVTFFYESSQYKLWYTIERIDYNINTRHRLGNVSYQTLGSCIDCPHVDSIRVIKRNGERNVFNIPWNADPGYSGYYPSITVGSSTYNDIYRLDLLEDGGIPFWDDTKLLWGTLNGTAQFSSYYWAKDIGLIQIKYKKTLDTGLDSAYWNLKSYNILKF